MVHLFNIDDVEMGTNGFVDTCLVCGVVLEILMQTVLTNVACVATMDLTRTKLHIPDNICKRKVPKHFFLVKISSL